MYTALADRIHVNNRKSSVQLQQQLPLSPAANHARTQLAVNQESYGSVYTFILPHALSKILCHLQQVESLPRLILFWFFLIFVIICSLMVKIYYSVSRCLFLIYKHLYSVLFFNNGMRFLSKNFQ